MSAPSYVQLLPAVPVSETAGWCLRFTERSFGLIYVDGNGNSVKNVPGVVIRPTAWSEWLATKYKHLNRNFPGDVSFPVWFDWWGQLPGDKQRYQYGHVAYHGSDGRIYSSPLSGVGRVSFATVDELCRAFGDGMKFVGWSEDIAGVSVITEGEDMERIKKLEDMANHRQAMLDKIASLYSVPAPLDGNSLPQLLSNISTEKKRIDELTGIVGTLESELKLSSGTIDKGNVLEYLKKNLK